MDANNPNISENDRNSILNHIINCANCALQNEDAFQKAMHELADKLRRVFDSEYCSIGIVIDGYAEDSVISYKKFKDKKLSIQQNQVLKSYNRARLDEDKYIVCQALKSDKDIFLHEEKIDRYINNEYYHNILTSGHVKNSYVIHLRDKAKKSLGFIQFINTKKDIDYKRDISPYSDALLGLVQVIIKNKKNRQEKENRLNDAVFYEQMQDKRDDVEQLLDSIMKYLSKEFNAAIISFRIPVLNGYQKVPLFYLRKYFIHQSINEESRNKLKSHYDTDRLIKKDKMNIVDKLRCDLEGTVFENESDSNFSQYGLELNNNTIIIAIFRNYENKCIHPQRNKSEYCKENEHLDCKYRFKKLYGIFRVRISKTKLSNNNANFYFNFEEIKERLGHLSKQISLLLNSIVDKHENESLQIFQNELKNSSFIKIKDFDERCVEIIKSAIHAKVCSIYRYGEQTKLLSLNATTAKSIHFIQMNEVLNTNRVIDNSCYVHINDKTNILTRVFDEKRTKYILNMRDKSIHESLFIEFVGNEQRIDNHSAMVVPMLKKDGSCAGIVLLLGKEEHKHSISTAYWEHDVDHIEFIVNILTRISESDTERLTFLSQLSHELLAPVTVLVNDSGLTIKRWNKNPDLYSKEFLINKLRENIYRNMLFKYIVSDTEFIYSTSKNTIQYNIVKQDKPQQILLDAIRLLEKEAIYKGLEIITYISKMPPLYFDKERMMQVFLNLLKNAIRYSDSNTKISISYNYSGTHHEISFSNFGIEIQEKEKESIFDLFHRGEEAKKKVIRGTGMGLYIVRDIMRAHGGDCYVNKLKGPSEFIIYLPNKESIK